MNFFKFTWWHWALIGAALGAAVAGVRIHHAEYFARPDGYVMVSLDHLLSEIDPDHPDRPRLRDVAVTPNIKQPGTYYLSGWIMESTRKNPEPRRLDYWMMARTPFQTQDEIRWGVRPEPDRTVMDYLAEVVGRRFSDFSYTYCWWESRGGLWLTWVMGGALLLGAGMPALFLLLARAGYTPSREPADDYDLDRFKPESASAQRPATALLPEEARRLSELEAEMEKRLSGTKLTGTPSAGTSNAEIRKLDAQPLEASASESQGPGKDFGAEKDDFYPTEIHHGAQKPKPNGP